jgi:hypothetical protein
LLEVSNKLKILLLVEVKDFRLMGGYRDIIEGWIAKLEARLLAAAALWVRIQTSLKIS